MTQETRNRNEHDDQANVVTTQGTLPNGWKDGEGTERGPVDLQTAAVERVAFVVGQRVRCMKGGEALVSARSSLPPDLT